MPFAQLRELVVECDRLAEGTIDDSAEHAEPAVEPTIEQIAYRLTVTATNDRGDCALVVDSPTQPTTVLDRTAQDAHAFTRTDHPVDAVRTPALDAAIGALDVELDADDTVDDFEAQPTAYRVRTLTLDSVLASLPPR